MDDTRVEEELAHLRRTCDDLSEMVARQERDIARLSRQMALLMERAAAQEQEGTGSAIFAEKPPHW
jgi:SlyX protein